MGSTSEFQEFRESHQGSALRSAPMVRVYPPLVVFLVTSTVSLPFAVEAAPAVAFLVGLPIPLATFLTVLALRYRDRGPVERSVTVYDRCVHVGTGVGDVWFYPDRFEVYRHGRATTVPVDGYDCEVVPGLDPRSRWLTPGLTNLLVDDPAEVGDLVRMRLPDRRVRIVPAPARTGSPLRDRWRGLRWSAFLVGAAEPEQLCSAVRSAVVDPGDEPPAWTPDPGDVHGFDGVTIPGEGPRSRLAFHLGIAFPVAVTLTGGILALPLALGAATLGELAVQLLAGLGLAAGAGATAAFLALLASAYLRQTERVTFGLADVDPRTGVLAVGAETLAFLGGTEFLWAIAGDLAPGFLLLLFAYLAVLGPPALWIGSAAVADFG